MTQKKLSKSILLALLIYLSLPSPALAYLDPGSGSYIFQIIIASLFGLAYSIKKYWKQTRSFIARVLSKITKQ